MGKEKRKRTRVPVGFEAAVSLGEEKIDVQTLNISLNGILCTTDSRFLSGEKCLVTLTLNPTVKVIFEGKILRVTPSETAIAFSAMNEESFIHLKKIVEYNYGDADKIDRELADPLFS
ncbi:MAG: PilZ domain-containing protein [Deltaproteobacteria bacterium]|jgi:Tfp pilus assembly protein PilZ|nr:PilZ domain-containing protein [Deltaproteobacteria bacterium]